MNAVEAREKLRDAKVRLKKARGKAHPDAGILAGAKADVSFWTRFYEWQRP